MSADLLLHGFSLATGRNGCGKTFEAEFRLALGKNWPGKPANIQYVPSDKPFYNELVKHAVATDPTVLTTEIARMSGFANDDFLGVLSGITLPESSSVLETVWKEIERRQLTTASEATRWNPEAEKDALRARVAELEVQVQELQHRPRETPSAAGTAAASNTPTAPGSPGYRVGTGYEAKDGGKAY
eukprot:COSAG03_NODE_276_length_9556_cov_8.462360_7_plen_186_part_00